MRNDAEQPTYPVIGFLVRRGRMLAVLAAALLFLAGTWGAIATGTVWWAACGAVLGLAVWLLLASYVEVLRIVSDMLMPR